MVEGSGPASASVAALPPSAPQLLHSYLILSELG